MTQLEYNNGMTKIMQFKRLAAGQLSKVSTSCYEDCKDADKKRLIHWEVLNELCEYYSKYPELVLAIIDTFKSPKKWTFVDEYDAYSQASCTYSNFGTLFSTRYELSFTPANSNNKVYFYKSY